MNEMSYAGLIRNIAIAYFAIGAVFCLVHPKLFGITSPLLRIWMWALLAFF